LDSCPSFSGLELGCELKRLMGDLKSDLLPMDLGLKIVDLSDLIQVWTSVSVRVECSLCVCVI